MSEKNSDIKEETVYGFIYLKFRTEKQKQSYSNRGLSHGCPWVEVRDYLLRRHKRSFWGGDGIPLNEMEIFIVLI